MRKAIVAIVALITAQACCIACDGFASATGSVVDDTGTPLSDVTVLIVNRSNSAAPVRACGNDGLGNFVCNVVTARTAKSVPLIAFKPGWKPAYMELPGGTSEGLRVVLVPEGSSESSRIEIAK